MLVRLAASALLAFIICAVAAQADDAAQKGGALVAEAKAEMGGAAWDRIQIWHETGHATDQSSTTTRYEHWGNLRTLEFRNSSTRNGETNLYVFDGNSFWQRSGAKFVRGGFDARAGSYEVCFGFFFPDRFPAKMRYVGTTHANGNSYDIVEISPSGSNKFEVWLDQHTHRIARLVDPNATVSFSGYRNVAGVLVPFVQETDSQTITTESLEFVPDNRQLFNASDRQ